MCLIPLALILTKNDNSAQIQFFRAQFFGELNRRIAQFAAFLFLQISAFFYTQFVRKTQFRSSFSIEHNLLLYYSI